MKKTVSIGRRKIEVSLPVGCHVSCQDLDQIALSLKDGMRRGSILSLSGLPLRWKCVPVHRPNQVDMFGG